MAEATITNAQYYAPDSVVLSVRCTYNGEVISVPLDASNRHYAEILRQVEAGTLAIQEAD
jgi:hypothetical protein